MRRTCLMLLLFPFALSAQLNPDYDPDFDLNGCYTMMDLLAILVTLMPDVEGNDSPNPNYDPDFDGDGEMTIYDMTSYLTWFGSCAGVPCESPTMDGYSYVVVEIGLQCWFAENLRTTVYADGSDIPEIISNEDWGGMMTGGQCTYQHDSDLLEQYGRLYNWYAVDDARGLCPVGWHVPDDDEWKLLENVIGMPWGQLDEFGNFRGSIQEIGTKLKSTYGWSSDGNGTDLFGFSGLPAGVRGGEGDDSGQFTGLGDVTFWWTSSPTAPEGNAFDRILAAFSAGVNRNSNHHRFGFSVRCLRDD